MRHISPNIYLLKKTRFIGAGNLFLFIQSLITVLICILKMFLVVNMVSIGTLIGLQQCYSIHKKNQYIVCCNAFLFFTSIKGIWNLYLNSCSVGSYLLGKPSFTFYIDESWLPNTFFLPLTAVNRHPLQLNVSTPQVMALQKGSNLIFWL